MHYKIALKKIGKKLAGNLALIVGLVMLLAMKHNSSLVLATLLLSGCGAIMSMNATAADVTPAATDTNAAAAPFSVTKADSEGFIHDWLILDPIVLADAADQTEDVIKPILAKEYFKDQLKVQPQVADKVMVGTNDLQWREVKLDAATKQIDLVQFATANNFATESVLFWGVAYVVADDDMSDVKLAIGSDDSSRWWVNGEEVITAYESRPVNPDDSMSKPIKLKKGVNEVRFAVINGGGEAGACARFLDANGKPVTNLAVSAVPPAK
jgi:uncharacterized protein YceK